MRSFFCLIFITFFTNVVLFQPQILTDEDIIVQDGFSIKGFLRHKSFLHKTKNNAQIFESNPLSKKFIENRLEGKPGRLINVMPNAAGIEPCIVFSHNWSLHMVLHEDLISFEPKKNVIVAKNIEEFFDQVAHFFLRIEDSFLISSHTKKSLDISKRTLKNLYKKCWKKIDIFGPTYKTLLELYLILCKGQYRQSEDEENALEEDKFDPAFIDFHNIENLLEKLKKNFKYEDEDEFELVDVTILKNKDFAQKLLESGVFEQRELLKLGFELGEPF